LKNPKCRATIIKGSSSAIPFGAPGLSSSLFPKILMFSFCGKVNRRRFNDPYIGADRRKGRRNPRSSFALSLNLVLSYALLDLLTQGKGKVRRREGRKGGVLRCLRAFG